MHTLFDFITHIKTVEYLLAIAFIAAFIVYWEILKPRPFLKLATDGREELEHLRQLGMGNTLKKVGMVAGAPFIGLFYLVALPLVFFYALGSSIVVGVYRLFGGTSASFGWRPAEAYLDGKGEKKEQPEKSKEKAK